MKPPSLRLALWSLILLALGLGSPVARAQDQEQPQPQPQPSAGYPASEHQHLPGVAIAHTLAEVTGVAISPLLGVSAVGAIRYWRAEAVARPGLPWFCQPWAWGTGFVLLGLCFLKDTIGTAAPTLLKKPLDFLELFENKLSALVASAAFVPLLATAAAMTTSSEPPSASLEPATAGLATMGFTATLSWWKLALYLPGCLATFFIVWLASHSINVLIALSPFGVVDAVLKLARIGLLTLLAGATWLSPWLGLAMCLPIIVIAWMVSGWAWRLTCFGTLCGWDILTGRKAAPDEVKGVEAFLARPAGPLPVRTRGRLRREPDGTLAFRVRPWGVLPPRVHALERAPDGLVKGLIFPCVTHRSANGTERNEFYLRPSLREETEAAGRLLGIGRIRDGALRGGLKAMRTWLASMGRAGEGSAALPG